MRNTAMALALSLACAGVQAETLAPFQSIEQTGTLAEEEDRVWAESHDFERAMRNLNLIYADADLQRYLQELMDALFPELKGAIRVKIQADPVMNAFALANGGVYINMGLIARVDNEAQLAAVLAHEGAHFAHRHGFRQRGTLKTSAAAALVLGAVGGIYGALLGNFAAAGAIFGHSRELEIEADQYGFARLQAQGYDARAAMVMFQRLDEEAKLLELPEPLVFATHPKLLERIESHQQLLSKSPQGGRLEEAAFLGRTHKVRLDWMQAELAAGRHKSLIHILSDPARAPRYGGTSQYFLAEAYRLRGEPEDATRAQLAYAECLNLVPNHAPSIRGLGMLAMKRGDKAEAQARFARYLELAPSANDSEYVKHYLAQLSAPAPVEALASKEKP